MSERLTVQEIARRAMASIGLPVPASIVNQADDAATQLVQCLYEAAEEMISKADWQAIKIEASFLTVAAEDQGDIYTKFPDFRRFVEDTVWNTTTQRKLVGPVSSQDWREAQATGVVVSTSNLFRVNSDHFYILGQSTADETIALEYISTRWLLDTNGLDRKSVIARASDICLLPSEAMVAGVTWRYLHKNGQDATAAFNDFMKFCGVRMGEDGGKRILNMVPRRSRTMAYPYDVRVENYE